MSWWCNDGNIVKNVWQTDRQTDRRADWTIPGAAWSQLKTKRRTSLSFLCKVCHAPCFFIVNFREISGYNEAYDGKNVWKWVAASAPILMVASSGCSQWSWWDNNSSWRDTKSPWQNKCRPDEMKSRPDGMLFYFLLSLLGFHRKHSYSTFWFTGNGVAPTTNKYCDFNATLTYSVMNEKYNLQCPKLMQHYRIYRNAPFLITFNNF